MGQKVHPYGFRLGVIKTWNSKWFEDKNYAKWLHEDMRIKRAVKEYLMNANIASVEVERAANKAKVIVFTARPGMVIGKGGKGIEILKIGNLKTAVKGETKFAGVQSFTDNEVFIDVQEIRKAETSAQLVAEYVAMQLERRVAFRRAMKKALSTAMKFGAKGIRIRCSGRLGGSEMSRVETYREGRVPLHTLRAELAGFTNNKEVFVNIKEIRKAELDAQLVAENVALQLERRVAFRRAMKKAMISTMKFGAEGIRIQCSGRLGGAEMGRREWYREGRVPLHTLRAEIDYGLAEAKTTYGVIGVKCWVFKGDVSDKDLRRGTLAERVNELQAR